MYVIYSCYRLKWRLRHVDEEIGTVRTPTGSGPCPLLLLLYSIFTPSPSPDDNERGHAPEGKRRFWRDVEDESRQPLLHDWQQLNKLKIDIRVQKPHNTNTPLNRSTSARSSASSSRRNPPNPYRDVSLQRYTLGFLLSNIRYLVILKMLMTCTFRKPILSLVYKAVAYFVDLDLLIRFFI